MTEAKQSGVNLRVMLDYTLSSANNSMVCLLEANGIKAVYVGAHLFRHKIRG